MEIKPKYEIGTQVISITPEHTLKKFEIAAIGVFAKKGYTNVVYYPSDGKGGLGYDTYDEKICFSNVEDALAYVKGKIS